METSYHSFFKLFVKVSKKIHSGREVTDILKCIVENITDIMAAKGCIYWILNHQKKTIVTKISHGFDYRSLSGTDYQTLLTIFDRTEPHIFIEDARNDTRIPDLERLGKQRVGSVTGLFFDIMKPYSGILAVYFSQHKPLDSHEFELISALGEQGALALQRAIGYDEKMVEIYQQIVEGFALAIEAKDPITHGHSKRVAVLSELTAKKMKLDEHEVKNIYRAGILHDIGKIGMEDTVLERLGELSQNELSAIRQHPVLGAKILSPLTFFNEIEPLVRHHHELYNGTGYPDGKKGEDIPLGARIITVCDAFETMISGRPQIRKKNLFLAIQTLQEGVGIRFDPKIVQAFFKVLRENPDVLDIRDTMESCLTLLKKNMADMADQNLFEKKISTGFPASF
ncbi:MAG: HD domain-containing protein [Desulfobacula sp.]|uniref:HD-GYP domain-containing protein n=1 Tax=Desulfobacula sp. TaxID=2593537 RepID=UPI0025BC2696|nr:HD domain-containing phosphohydrolase [Desulfobacula sp.]MCD4721488.1 HD domain-containing protein [Desulfobacula sp.]